MLQYILVIGALESWTTTTLLFPAAMVIACLGVVTLILARRKVLRREG